MEVTFWDLDFLLEFAVAFDELHHLVDDEVVVFEFGFGFDRFWGENFEKVVFFNDFDWDLLNNSLAFFRVAGFGFFIVLGFFGFLF